MIYLSQNLVYYREKRGLTQKLMSELLQVSLCKYQSWEEGRRNPSPENLIKLCQLFEINDLLAFLSEKIYLSVA